MTHGGNHSYRFKLNISREHADNVRDIRRIGTFEGPVVIDDEGHPRLIGVECDTEFDHAILNLLGAMPPDRVATETFPNAQWLPR